MRRQLPNGALVKGFGRRPVARRWCEARGRRSKASQGGNRGEERRCVRDATYGGSLHWKSRISPRHRPRGRKGEAFGQLLRGTRTEAVEWTVGPLSSAKLSPQLRRPPSRCERPLYVDSGRPLRVARRPSRRSPLCRARAEVPSRLSRQAEGRDAANAEAFAAGTEAAEDQAARRSQARPARRAARAQPS